MHKRLGSFTDEQLITLGIGFFFLLIFVGSFQYHPMSRLFPSIVSGAGILICALHFYVSRRARRADTPDLMVAQADPDPTREELVRALLLVATGTISFIFLGFWITSIGLVLFVPRLMGWRANPLVLIVIAAITVGGIALMFNVILKSPMPRGAAIDWAARNLTPPD